MPDAKSLFSLPETVTRWDVNVGARAKGRFKPGIAQLNVVEYADHVSIDNVPVFF